MPLIIALIIIALFVLYWIFIAGLFLMYIFSLIVTYIVMLIGSKLITNQFQPEKMFNYALYVAIVVMMVRIII